MSDDELDPEVLADLQLRAASERDTSRTAKEAVWVPPVIVDKVPCRGRCGSVIEWTEEAESAFQTWNRMLLAKREAPLDKTRVVFCIPCRTAGREANAANNRKAVEQMQERIVRLRNSADPFGEKQLLDEIRKLGHPDIKGLIDAIVEKRKKPGAGKARMGGM